MDVTLHEHALGLTWVVDEPMERASHALRVDGRVWLVDPVAWEPALEAARELGAVAGVLQLLDRHERDGAAVASRFGVPLRPLPRMLPEAPFELRRLVDRPWWREVALWWPEERALIVPEAVATATYYGLGRPLGVHPMLRLRPPSGLRGLDPEHVLGGHGAPLHGPTARTALAEALARSRGDLPRFLRRLPAMARELR